MAVIDLILDGTLEVTEQERARALSQWYTDEKLADKTARWAVKGWEGKSITVLEPTAGDGALVKAVLKQSLVNVTSVTAVDIDPRNITKLEALKQQDPRVGIQRDNFITWADKLLEHPIFCEPFDLGIANPPYENGMDVRVLQRVVRLCKRTVAILRSDVVFGQKRRRFWDRHRIMRRANLSARPSFQEPWQPEENNGESDFVVLHIRRRDKLRVTGEVDLVREEWW